VRATSYSYVEGENWGYQNSETPNRLPQNLACVITSAIWPSKPKFKPIVPANGWNITFALFLIFCDQNFCSCLETKPENRFLHGLIPRMSIPRYCNLRRIKLQKCFDFLNFYPKNTPKRAWICIFKPNAQNIKTCMLSKLLHGFQTNFAQWQRPPNTLRELSKPAYNKP